jgi:hypothetical protein
MNQQDGAAVSRVTVDNKCCVEEEDTYTTLERPRNFIEIIK